MILFNIIGIKIHIKWVILIKNLRSLLHETLLSLFLISLICLISTSPNLVFATVGNEATEVIKGDINLDGKLDSEDIKLLKGVLLGDKN